MKNIPVPLLKQGRLECGPTALRMVLRYFGVEVSLDEIIKEVGGIKNYGVRTIKLAEFAEKLGFRLIAIPITRDLERVGQR